MIAKLIKIAELVNGSVDGDGEYAWGFSNGVEFSLLLRELDDRDDLQDTRYNNTLLNTRI